jgi:hypothetical protein
VSDLSAEVLGRRLMTRDDAFFGRCCLGSGAATFTRFVNEG